MKEFKRLLRWLRAPTEAEKNQMQMLLDIYTQMNFDAANIRDICMAVQFMQQRMSSMDAKMTPETQSIDTIIGNLHTIQSRLNNIEWKVDQLDIQNRPLEGGGKIVVDFDLIKALTEKVNDLSKKVEGKKKNVKNK